MNPIHFEFFNFAVQWRIFFILKKSFFFLFFFGHFYHNLNLYWLYSFKTIFEFCLIFSKKIFKIFQNFFQFPKSQCQTKEQCFHVCLGSRKNIFNKFSHDTNAQLCSYTKQIHEFLEELLISQ